MLVKSRSVQRLPGELFELSEQVCGDNRIFDRVVVSGRLALLGEVGHDGRDNLVTLFGMGGQVGIDHRGTSFSFFLPNATRSCFAPYSSIVRRSSSSAS